MAWLWIALGALAFLAGLRHRLRIRAARVSETPPVVDDDAVRRILDHGTLAAASDEDEPLDLRAVAEAEEEFWAEEWDEPEED